MKRVVLLLLSILVSVSAFAQWLEPNYHRGDELKGTEGYIEFTYVSDNGMFDYAKHMFVICDQGSFEYDADQEVVGLIGFYRGDKLVDKTEAVFFIFTEDYNAAAIESDSIAKKVHSHLRSTGSVRFLIPRKNKRDFDMTVPQIDRLMILAWEAQKIE